MSLFDLIPKKLAGNAIMQAAAGKVKEIDVPKVTSFLLQEAHDVVQELKKDADGDGLTELENIEKDIQDIHEKFGDIFDRIAAAKARSEAQE